MGDTLRDRRILAIVAASFVNRPAGGCVESVFTFDTHRFEPRLVSCAALLDLPRMICWSLKRLALLRARNQINERLATIPSEV